MSIFEWPVVFSFILLPVAARWVLRPHAADAGVTQALRVPFFKRVQSLTSASPVGGRRWVGVLLSLAFLSFVVAGARPVWYGTPVVVPQEARQILLGVDVSDSMAARDFVIGNRSASRLDVVKAVVNDFLKTRVHDNIGIVLFGSEAFAYVPITPDIPTARTLFADVDVGMAGSLTALGEALALCVQQVSQIPSAARIVILLSDGRATVNTVPVDKALAFAKEQGVTVYTIGIGADMGDALDEATLRRIATETGGRYFKAESIRDLRDVYALIDKMETVETKTPPIRPRTELFYVPLLFGLALLALAFLTRRRV